MAKRVVAPKQTSESRTRVKTGCTTCRIRKVKCDEAKPVCQKCVDTGRTCDGYDSHFRPFVSQSVVKVNTAGKSKSNSPQAPDVLLTRVNCQNVKLLNRLFSTKTLFDVELGCDEEARQVLEASSSSPPLQHALLSLRSLRGDLETFRDGTRHMQQQTASYQYGLQQYSMALGGLASHLSFPSLNDLKSILLCCQMFISIEQVQGNYAAMAQHIIRGLKIMHEYRARPELIAANKLAPAHRGQLPLLDVFVIKIFAAPCKFAEPSSASKSNDANKAIATTCQQPVEPRSIYNIAPDMRKALTRIAESTLEYLNKISHIASTRNVVQLLSEKTALLEALDSWLSDVDGVRIGTETYSRGPEPIAMSFLRFFQAILKIVLLGALDSSPNFHAQLQSENDHLQSIADRVAKRLQGYRISKGTSRTSIEPSKAY